MTTPGRRIRPPRFGAGGPCTAEEKARIEAMSVEERVDAMYDGLFTYRECAWWASRWPHQVPLINNEYAYLAAFEAEAAESDEGNAPVVDLPVSVEQREERAA